MWKGINNEDHSSFSLGTLNRMFIPRLYFFFFKGVTRQELGEGKYSNLPPISLLRAGKYAVGDFFFLFPSR